MTLDKKILRPSMEGPCTYRIRVLGHLYETWVNRLGGMKVVECHELDGQVETVLQGHLADQAALTGVLNALYELHLPIISAEYLGEIPSPARGVTKTTPQ